jgi:uncharacterized membrane protein YjfL (UPF0719 family)
VQGGRDAATPRFAQHHAGASVVTPAACECRRADQRAGVLVGFALPLGGAVAHGVSLLDMLLWAVIALAVQLIAYIAVRFSMPHVIANVRDGQVASGALLGAVALSVGILNAASMTY